MFSFTVEECIAAAGVPTYRPVFCPRHHRPRAFRRGVLLQSSGLVPGSELREPLGCLAPDVVGFELVTCTSAGMDVPHCLGTLGSRVMRRALRRLTWRRSA